MNMFIENCFVIVGFLLIKLICLLCVSYIFYSPLMYTVIVLEPPAALCLVYGARDSKKTDVGGKW